MFDYPAFRKYPNDRNFFKINSETEFEEVQKIGEQYFHYRIETQTYAERLRIEDMLKKEGGYWLDSSESEFNFFLGEVNSPSKG